MSRPLSGDQFHLSWGEYAASIASVGASLRALEHRGRPLVVPFRADEARPAYRGAVLAPWPNRVIDGRYTFADLPQQLPLTEPRRGHALHGLVAWLNFTPSQTSSDSVQLIGSLEAQAGYPHRLDVTVSYRLDDNGLHCRVTGTNTGTTPAPWGASTHPYLVAGPGRVDDWILTLPAASVMRVNEDRLIPQGLCHVATEMGGRYDFRQPRALHGILIDHAFSSLQRDAQGVTSAALRAADGRGVAMTWDTTCPWVQIHTADTTNPRTSRIGLAVEPMTCPPDAFNSGTDLTVLDPDASATVSWTISALSSSPDGSTRS